MKVHLECSLTGKKIKWIEGCYLLNKKILTRFFKIISLIILYDSLISLLNKRHVHVNNNLC